MDFDIRDIFKNALTADEIKQMHIESCESIDKFVNIRGKAFKESSVKDRFSKMTDEEKYEFLASDPKLIKRPIIKGKSSYVFGFDKRALDALVMDE